MTMIVGIELVFQKCGTSVLKRQNLIKSHGIRLDNREDQENRRRRL